MLKHLDLHKDKIVNLYTFRRLVDLMQLQRVEQFNMLQKQLQTDHTLHVE